MNNWKTNDQAVEKMNNLLNKNEHYAEYQRMKCWINWMKAKQTAGFLSYHEQYAE